MRNRLPTLLTALAAFVLASCSTAAAPAASGSAADEQAIREIAGKYAAAMSAKDTAALGALVTEDYETVEATGDHTQGRGAVLAMAAKDFAAMPAGMSMSMTATTTFVRWIDANHAVAGGTWETSPAMPPMPSKGSWNGVLVKQGDSWRMLSALGAADLSAMAMPETTKPKTP